MAEGAGGDVTTDLDLDAIEARAKAYLVGKDVDWLMSNRLANDVVGVVAEVRRLREAAKEAYEYSAAADRLDANVRAALSALPLERTVDAAFRAISRAESAEAERDQYRCRINECEAGPCGYAGQLVAERDAENQRAEKVEAELLCTKDEVVYKQGLLLAAIARAEKAEAKVAMLCEALRVARCDYIALYEGTPNDDVCARMQSALDSALALDSTDGREA